MRPVFDLRSDRYAVALGYLAALGAVALVTALIALVVGRVPMANVSMFYLIAVLATAVVFGSGPAILASLAAFLAFDWFFVDPLYSVTVAKTEEWVSLLLFLVTAVVTGQLAAGQRERAREAREHEREAVVLYDVVRLMSEPNLGQALTGVADRLRHELDLAAVAIHLPSDGSAPLRAEAGDPEALRLIQARHAVESRALGAGMAPNGAQRGRPGTWRSVVPPAHPQSGARTPRGLLHEVPVQGPGQRPGALFLVRRPDGPTFGPGDDRLLSAVALQLGIALERARLRREATEAEILRRTDELKTELLNAVSHDLRTPLAAIITAAGSLLQEDVPWTAQDRGEFARDIEQEALRLNRIVGNLLDLSRLEAGSLHPEMGWYDLGALVDDVLGRLRPATAHHRLTKDVPDDLPPVPLDYVEIDQVLSNLIENATKYTPPGTEIHVAVRCRDGEVQVEVADRGPGIPQAALTRLFEPFYRGDGAAIRPRGTGLGLAVAKGLVEAHGGRIWAEDRPEGGARFVFTLPLTARDDVRTDVAREGR